METAAWYYQYELSMYFMFITMLTIGYGDVTPYNTPERIYVIIITLIACGIFRYAINTVGAILQQLDFENSLIRYETSRREGSVSI